MQACRDSRAQLTTEEVKASKFVIIIRWGGEVVRGLVKNINCYKTDWKWFQNTGTYQLLQAWRSKPWILKRSLKYYKSECDHGILITRHIIVILCINQISTAIRAFENTFVIVQIEIESWAVAHSCYYKTVITQNYWTSWNIDPLFDKTSVTTTIEENSADDWALILNYCYS